MRNKKTRKKSGSMISAKTWFAIHAWSGFKLSILLFVVFASGTLATISHELDWLADSDLRVEVRESGYDFAAMLNGLHTAFPAARVDQIERPAAEGFAAVARIRDPELGLRRVELDPYTGQVLETGHWYGSFQRLLRDFHRYLMLPSYLGMFVVGATAFLALASLISSFWIYPNWWRGFFRFRPGRSGDAPIFKELHKLLGVWSIVFVLIMGVTGVWYVLEYTLALAGADDDLQIEWTTLSDQRVTALAPGQRQLEPAEVIGITRAELPGIEIGIIVPPTTPDSPYYIAGQTGELLVRDRASHVFIDPYDGSVLARQHASSIGPVRRWVDTADPLHFGNFAGLWSKIPYLLFGTAMTLLAATGIWLRWKRIRRMFHRGPAKAAQARRARMGGWKWASITVLILTVVFGTWQVQRFSQVPRDWHSVGELVMKTGNASASANVFRSGSEYYAVLPPRVHFDPERHAVSIPACGIGQAPAQPDIHHRIFRLPDAGRLDPDCLAGIAPQPAIENSQPATASSHTSIR
ncbi:MAG: PepSY domain-containing protein [Wenzhouxiangellaceae bacterium]|nr:PepSY domain-containing protein [Wenzhouxiangellaceae bacterium]MBS3747337.1 PepSY domain-containing protein [Wenzhouxiangellaceae bacterium]MBS3824800.1 PepSY domain-containing protein [Wenzhouxiangellaceae bacterium]